MNSRYGAVYLQRVIFELREMERLSAPGRVTEHLSNVWLGRVVEFLLGQKCILEVARLLYILKQDGRSLPADVYFLDDQGQSFHTRWLPTFFAGQHFERRNQGRLYLLHVKFQAFVRDVTFTVLGA